MSCQLLIIKFIIAVKYTVLCKNLTKNADCASLSCICKNMSFSDLSVLFQMGVVLGNLSFNRFHDNHTM